MPVYVDGVSCYPLTVIANQARRFGRSWSHMFADDVDELHQFARGIGLKRSYFQDKPGFPHYDVTPIKRNLAILRGAKVKQAVTFLRERKSCQQK